MASAAAAAAAGSRVAVITGAGSGIGRALALRLVEGGVKVIAVGRTKAKLEAVQKDAGNAALVSVVPADVSSAAGRSTIVQSVREAGRLDFVVQNAGTIQPIAKLEGINEDAWMRAFAVNVHAPVFLLRALLPFLSSGSRVLHIGSGASEKAIGGWTAYCATKAAFKSIWRSLAQELRPSGVWVGSVRPGIVNTPMQAEIRAAGEDAMPDVEVFRGFFDKAEGADEGSKSSAGRAPPSGALDSADNCATFLSFLLLKTGDEEFAADEWDIRDPSHHSRWAAPAE